MVVELDPATVMLPATFDMNPVSADRTDDTCIPNLRKFPFLLPLLSAQWFSRASCDEAASELPRA